MKIDSAKWVEQYKKSAKTLGDRGCGPSDGIVCIHATLSYIKAGLAEDAAKPVAEDAKPMTPEDSLNELLKSCVEGKPQGFASNASAAMKAAKLETGIVSLGDLKMD